MSDRKAGSCIVTYEEVIDCPYTYQRTLNIIKDKGAPLLGCCILLLDSKYKWFVEPDDGMGQIEFRWELKEN